MKTTRKIQYFKFDNELVFKSYNPKTNYIITVNLYNFHTAIDISNYSNNSYNYRYDEDIECTKLEFDKAFDLALALLTNKVVNKK